MGRFTHFEIVMNRRVLGIVIGVIAVVGMPSGAQATFAGQNGRIFYVVGAYTTSSTIMSACSDGTHVTNVVPLATFPSPSPDGTKLAYNKLKVIGGSADNDGIWIANADGSAPVQITDGTHSPYSPTWSPDGTKLTFRQFVYYPAIMTSVMQPVVADVATKVITPLLSDLSYSIATEQTATNVWSPDGTQIFFPGGGDVYRVAAGGGTPTRVLGTDADFPFTVWFDISPDGISMLEQHQGTAISDLLSETWRYPLGGGSGTKVLESSPSEGTGDEIASYSPDGTKIVFDRMPSEQIMTADPDGSNVAIFGSSYGAYARWSTNTDGCADPGDPGAATMKINEVGLGAARFIELLDPADETFPSAQQPFRVVVYDGAGTRQGAQTISSALLQGRDNTQPLLLSTAAADLAYGVVGDVVLSLPLPSPGQACFTKGFDEAKVDCVSWGCVTVAVSTSSARIPAPGAGIAAQRQGVGSTTFHLASPTPKATNVAGAAVPACSPPGAPPTPVSVVSRKIHGGAGTFDLALSLIAGNPTTEPRANGAGGEHTLVFSFDKAVLSGNVAVTEGLATVVGAPTFTGNDIVVAIAGAPNANYATVAVTAVAAGDGGSGGAGSVRVGFLAGDVSSNRVVTLSDILGVNAVLAQTVTASTFLRDVNVTGTLSLADMLLVNFNLTKSLPAP